MEDKKSFFVESILKWHEKHKRIFPWRKNRSAYRVLVAELMLQRTRAEQVSEIFDVFIKKYPNANKLATANPSELKTILYPLGLHHRIPRFVELFKKISSDYKGEVPSSFKELIKLPGIGRYIACAVLCFGFGREIPVVDVNIVRVLSRFFGIHSSKKRPHTDPIFWEYASELVKVGSAVKVNEAMLDFASLICLRKPRCSECPVKVMCTFFINN